MRAHHKKDFFPSARHCEAHASLMVSLSPEPTRKLLSFKCPLLPSLSFPVFTLSSMCLPRGWVEPSDTFQETDGALWEFTRPTIFVFHWQGRERRSPFAFMTSWCEGCSMVMQCMFKRGSFSLCSLLWTGIHVFFCNDNGRNSFRFDVWQRDNKIEIICQTRSFMCILRIWKSL